MIYIGMDDTDTADSRGTGALARRAAAELAADYQVLGVIRHQLLRDPRVPCTRNNSSKALLLEGGPAVDLAALAARVRAVMLADFIPGSDPGLCVTAAVPDAVVAFGRRAQAELLTQDAARDLAANHGLYLEGLGGDEMGVIGALAAVGLTAGGEAGRYIQVGCCRDLAGLQPVAALLAAGVARVETRDGRPVAEGLVLADNLRPARRHGVPVAVVEPDGDGAWVPVKLD
ncbi:MAG TPA: ABC transporter substrate-binding protein [Anaerolineae bacterium]